MTDWKRQCHSVPLNGRFLTLTGSARAMVVAVGLSTSEIVVVLVTISRTIVTVPVVV